MSASTDAVRDLVDRTPPANRTGQRAADTIARELARLPIPRIVGFHRGVVDLSNRALTWRPWEAADVIHRATAQMTRSWTFGHG